MMSKLGAILLTGLFALCTVGVSLPADAAKTAIPDSPAVSVPSQQPIDKILKKPTEKEMFNAKMQWIKGVPHNKLENVYLSAVFSEDMFKKIKKEENLAFNITELIDREFAGTGIKITPFAVLNKQAKSPEELKALLTKYDSGITIIVEKQDKGEVIVRGYLETPQDQLSYANYAARSLYGKNGSYNAKMLAFNKALRGFVGEIKAYKAGKIKI